MSMSNSDYTLPNSYNCRTDSKIKSLARKSGCPVFEKGIFTEEKRCIPYATYRLLRGEASLCSHFKSDKKKTNRENHAGEEHLQIQTQHPN